MSRLEKLWEPQSILFNFEKKRMHYPHHVQRKATMWEMSSLLVWSMQPLYSHDYPKCIGWLISFQSSWKVILKSCLLQFKKAWLLAGLFFMKILPCDSQRYYHLCQWQQRSILWYSWQMWPLLELVSVWCDPLRLRCFSKRTGSWIRPREESVP